MDIHSIRELHNNMTSILAGFKIGTATGCTLAVSTFIENGAVSIPVAVTVTMFVGTCVWWTSKRFQRIDDQLEHLRDRLQNLPCDKKYSCDDTDERFK